MSFFYFSGPPVSFLSFSGRRRADAGLPGEAAFGGGRPDGHQEVKPKSAASGHHQHYGGNLPDREEVDVPRQVDVRKDFSWK